MDPTTLTILFCIIVAIMIIGYLYQKNNTNFLFLPIAAGVMLVITGLILFTNPLTFQTGSESNITTEKVTTVYNFETIDNNANLMLGWVFVLVGLINIIIAAIIIYNKRYDEEELTIVNI